MINTFGRSLLVKRLTLQIVAALNEKLGSALAKQNAKEKECEEGILHRDHIVTEGSSTNVFIIREQVASSKGM